LAGAVCALVPILGPIVLLGYQFDIVEDMHRRGDNDYPDFDVNRIMDYLTRGVWPFIVQLIVLAPLALVAGVVVMLLLFAILAAHLHPTDAVLLVLALVLVFLVATAVATPLLPFLLIPMLLRAGLSQDFGSAFSWAFIRDFVGKTWKEIVLVELFVFAAGV